MHTPLWIKIGMGLGFAYIGLYGINILGNMGTPAPAHHEETEMASSEGGDGHGAAGTAVTAPEVEEVDVMTLLASVAGDAEKGASAAKKKCATCHSFDDGGPNKVGPNLFGISGRAKASHEGFKYSDALTSSGGDWSHEDLAHFIHSPKGFAPGTKMTFKGLDKPQELADVMAYLDTLK